MVPPMNGHVPEGTASAANDAAMPRKSDVRERARRGIGDERPEAGKYLDARMSHNDQAMDQARAAAVALAEELGERVSGVVLFGSAALGKATSNSDLDLLVIADALPERLGGRMRLLRQSRQDTSAPRRS